MADIWLKAFYHAQAATCNFRLWGLLTTFTRSRTAILCFPRLHLQPSSTPSSSCSRPRAFTGYKLEHHAQLIGLKLAGQEVISARLTKSRRVAKQQPEHPSDCRCISVVARPRVLPDSLSSWLPVTRESLNK
jgi:hypothetical protein